MKCYFIQSKNYGFVYKISLLTLFFLAECLKKRTVKPWIDKERLTGDILCQITSGIEDSKFFLCLVTKVCIILFGYLSVLVYASNIIQ